MNSRPLGSLSLLAAWCLLLGVVGVCVDVRAEESADKGTLSGSVADDTGAPVAGARVSVNESRFDSNTLQSTCIVLAQAVTDAQGRFQLGPLAAAYRPPYDLRIEADGFAPQYVDSRTYSIFPGADNDLGTLQVYPGSVVSGRVIDTDGTPCAGTTVECTVSRYYLGHTIKDIEPSQKVITDAAGEFSTAPLAVGRAVLSVNLPGRQLAYQSVQTKPYGSLSLPAPIRLEKDVPVEGVIRDEEGSPIEGVVIKANSQHMATSDSQGHFTLRGFGPNPSFQVHMSKEGYVFINWGVRVSDDGFSHSEVQADNPPQIKTKDFEIVMQRVAWIEGKAVDADTGEGIKLDKVVLCTFERKPNGEILLAGCRDSNFEQPTPGHFRLKYSQPDEYHLTVKAEGYQDGEAFTPAVTELQPIDGLVVKLKRKEDGTRPQIQQQQITGTVTRDDRPVKSGWVGLWGLRRPIDIVNAHIMRGRTASGDPILWAHARISDGTYTLDVPFQGAGFYLVVEDPGRALTQTGPIEVSVNEHKRLDIACAPGGDIHGRVISVPETWQGQLWAVAFSRTAVRAEARVRADGTFAFDGLPAGRYGLKVGHDAYRDAEVPGHGGLQEVPEDAWSKIADPWKRAVVVTVEAGRTTGGVDLELPAE